MSTSANASDQRAADAPGASARTHGGPPFRYTPALAQRIELRWQDRWEERGTFHAANPTGRLRGPGGAEASGSPFFIMDMFPYPSGAGLHVGHPLGFIATDVIGRYRRMCGDNVLHAMGFDAFGLPAEQHAAETGEHPRLVTERNITTYRRQLRRAGLAHDQRRSFATFDRQYVRWTQWMFLQIFESWYDESALRDDGGTGRARRIAELREELATGARRVPGHAGDNADGAVWSALGALEQRDVLDAQRLAYVDSSPVNWCPGLGTVLANEEVTAEGRSERGGFPVFPRELRQWKLRITAYADRLIDDLHLVDWPEKVKTMQRNWIGRSHSALGERTTTYRLRDWLFSRQRYWGEPFPIVWDEDDRPVALPESMLPVELPDVPDYAPRTFAPDDASSVPEAPLGRDADWVNVTLDLGDGPRGYRRDTNTMPNWAGSSWYHLRYLDPTDTAHAVDPTLEKHWLGPHHNATSGEAGGVDLYVGGVEHAVLHLLYVRFWHKVLFDLGYVSSSEPFGRLFNQGYIQAHAYTDARGSYVPAAEVVGDPRTGWTWRGHPVRREYGKIGKSLKNVVSPDDMYEAYGADTFRVYEMVMGPLDQSRPWNTRDVVGSQRFLQRLWRNVLSEETGQVTVVDDAPDAATSRALHRTIAEVRLEMENLRLNTAIARLIAFNNHLTSLSAVPRAAVEALILMTAPVAPHIAEELWERLGHTESLAHEPFPVPDPRYLAEDGVTCVLQVGGRMRARIEVAPDISPEALEAAALSDPGVVRALGGRGVRTVVVRAPRLVNIVPE